MPSAEKLSALRPAGGHRTLAERAFATLHEAIVTGVLAPGERRGAVAGCERLERRGDGVRARVGHGFKKHLSPFGQLVLSVHI